MVSRHPQRPWTSRIVQTAIAIAGAFAFGLSCDGGTPPEGPITYGIKPQDTTIFVNDSVLMRPEAQDGQGNPLTVPTGIVWSSSQQGVATVSTAGMVRGVGAGATTIMAQISAPGGSPSAQAIAVLNVSSPVSQVTITAPKTTLAMGETSQFSATPKDAAGTTVNRPVTWASSANAVATVSATGLVTAVAVGSTNITATSDGIVATQAVTVAPVTSVTITAAKTAFLVGETSQYTATPKDAGGNTLARPVTWSSSATGVATVSTSGLVTAVAAGSANITATSDGVTGTQAITVTAPGGGGPAPVVEETFANYTSTAHLISNPFGTFRTPGYDERTSDITLDLTTGFGSDRSMKFTFPDQTANTASRCTIDMSISRWVKFPAPVMEVWVEVYVKFSSNFTTIVPAGWGCGGNPDYKFLFLANNPPNGRWQIKNGTFGTHWSPNHNGGTNDTFTTTNTGNGGQWWDGQWHRVRWHARASTTLTSANGAFEWWLDDVKQTYPSNINTDAGGQVITGLTDLRLGANLNLGPGQTQSINWGRIRVYTTNPGW